jgi:predicted  nucleic acid-binding Zn-ribbon protein
MSEKDEAIKQIAELTDRRETVRAKLLGLSAQRHPALKAVEKAEAALAEAKERLAAADAEIAEARLPIVAELDEVRDALRAAHGHYQELVLAEAGPAPDDPGAVLGAPGVESEEALGDL